MIWNWKSHLNWSMILKRGMIQCVHKWWSSLYQKENQKNVKYNLTVDNKAQYYNVTKNLQRAILMSEVTFKIFVNDNDKLKWQVHLSDFIFFCGHDEHLNENTTCYKCRHQNSLHLNNRNFEFIFEDEFLFITKYFTSNFVLLHLNSPINLFIYLHRQLLFKLLWKGDKFCIVLK